MQIIKSNELVDYPSALELMHHRVQGIIDNTQDEAIWLLEHPPLYTAGTSAKEKDLLEKRFPVYDAGRGGEYTYHGPGQLVAYVMLKLEPKDVRLFVWRLEETIINTIAHFGVKGERREGRVGIWVCSPSSTSPLPEGRKHLSSPLPEGGDGGGFTQEGYSAHEPPPNSPPHGEGYKEEKIAAIGIRLKKWVSFHGISINLNPDLSHFSGIVPCGLGQYGVTSFEKLAIDIDRQEFEDILVQEFLKIFQHQ